MRKWKIHIRVETYATPGALALDVDLSAYRKGAVAIADMLMRMRGRKEAGDAA